MEQYFKDKSEATTGVPDFVNIFNNYYQKKNHIKCENKKGTLTHKDKYKRIPYIDKNFKLKLLTKVISKITSSKYFPIFPFKIEFHTYMEKYLEIYYKIGVKNICRYPNNIKQKVLLLFNKIINLWFDCPFDKSIITVDKSETCCICLDNFDTNEEIIACQNVLKENITTHCYHFKCYNKLYNSIWDEDNDEDDDYNDYYLNDNMDIDMLEENSLLIQNLLDKNLKVKQEYSNCMEEVVKGNRCVCCTGASDNKLNVSFYNRIIIN